MCYGELRQNKEYDRSRKLPIDGSLAIFLAKLGKICYDKQDIKNKGRKIR